MHHKHGAHVSLLADGQAPEGKLTNLTGTGTTASSGSARQGAIALFDPSSRGGEDTGNNLALDRQRTYVCIPGEALIKWTYMLCNKRMMAARSSGRQPQVGRDLDLMGVRMRGVGLGAQGDVLSTNT